MQRDLQRVHPQQLGHSVKVDIHYIDSGKDKGFADESVSIDRGDVEEVHLWFGSAPDVIDVKVDEGSEIVTKKILKSELPPIMQKDSSSGRQFRMDINTDGIVVRNLTGMDRFGWVVWTFGFIGLFIVIPIVVGHLLVRRYRRKHAA